jgi:predicted PurR-regulated permease PerM
LIALSQYWLVWFLVIVWFYTILQLFESHILVPLVMNQALGVNALLILLTMTLGWVLFGFVWIMLGVPLAVILSIFFEDLIKE